MIIAVGTDIIQVARVAASISRFGERFIRRILTPAETVQALAKSRPEAFVAKRFAAKEAMAKALGTGIGAGVSWQDIEVFNTDLGAPGLRLRAAALARSQFLGADAWHLSISDEREYAVAFVILESRAGSNKMRK